MGGKWAGASNEGPIAATDAFRGKKLEVLCFLERLHVIAPDHEPIAVRPEVKHVANMVGRFCKGIRETNQGFLNCVPSSVWCAHG